MLKQERINVEISKSTTQKFILNPFELLIYELQTKDIKLKKQSIQTLDVIALAMTQKSIVNQLFPFLMKTIVQQNSKDLKILLLRSFKKIIPLLNKQKSYLRALQSIFDVLIVFDQSQMRNQAFEVLNYLFFESQCLHFGTFKDQLKKLAIQQLPAIVDINCSENAKQLTIIIIKYLLRNLSGEKQGSSNLQNQAEVKQLIQFLKNQFILRNNDNSSGLKILSGKFHLLASEWPREFIRQLNYFISFFSGYQKPHSKDQQIISSDIKGVQQTNSVSQSILTLSTQNISQNKLTVSQTKLIVAQTKLSQPQLSKQIRIQLKINLISTLVQASKRFSVEQYVFYLVKLLQEQEVKIKIAIIKKIGQIFEIFDKQSLQSLFLMFRNFSQQNQQIKKVILQVLDQIPLQFEQKCDLIIKHSKNSIQLKNILIQNLIKQNRSTTIGQILNQSDYDFKIKIFMKLQDALLNNNTIYSVIVDSLLSQPKKNFRSKQTLIQNLINRIQQRTNDKNKQINFDISYLIQPALKYFSDRIAIIRTNIAKLCALIIFYYRVQFQSIQSQLTQSFYGEGKSWFQRQNVLLMIKFYFQLKQKQQNISKIKIQKNDKNFKFQIWLNKILKDTINGSLIKNKEGQHSSNKTSIKNIQLLAEQIIAKFNTENSNYKNSSQ